MTAHDVQTAATEPQIGAVLEPAHGAEIVVPLNRLSGHGPAGGRRLMVVLHLVDADDAGLIAALQVLAAIVETGKPASETCRLFTPLPQLLKNVEFNGGKPLDDKSVKEAIKDGEAVLGDTGRLLIRPSGTEPVIRVMAEGDDDGITEMVRLNSTHLVKVLHVPRSEN